MIYAFRESPHSRMLVEFNSQRQLEATNKANAARDGGVQHTFYRRVDAATAHRWVKNGNIHETCLWVDDGRIRRA